MNPTGPITSKTEFGSQNEPSAIALDEGARQGWGRIKIPMLGFLIWFAAASVYFPLLHHQFIDFDDQDYVTQNEMVQLGCSWKGFIWAFTTEFAGNWHPLTWLSHMVDYQFFGLNAGGHHFTNLLLHSTNALLLFLILESLTRAEWRSALVAALFALHPLHVESVAWASERKDVLSIFFGLLSLWCYVRYLPSFGACISSLRPAPARTGRPWKSWLYYAVALAAFACSLLSKSTLVTLPFLLLLLDYWPLNRLVLPLWESRNRHCLWDKIPFLTLSALSCLLTLSAQRHAGAVAALASYPLRQRIPNVIFVYAEYLKKMAWPTNLSVFYPMDTHRPLIQVVAAGFEILLISGFVYSFRRYFKYLTVGWLWYLGTLVPVIGIVHVGAQSMADRYTYFPLIGIFITLVWLTSDLLDRNAAGRVILSALASLVIIGCCIRTSVQLGYWANSESLFRHALAVTTDNYIAHQNLGTALVEQGRILEATPHFREAVRIKPRFAEAESDLGLALIFQSKIEEGIEHYRKAIAIKPSLQKTHYNLGRALAVQNKFDEATSEYAEAVSLDPTYREAREALALTLGQQQRYAEARDQFVELLKTTPNDPNLWFNLARCLKSIGREKEAVEALTEVTRLHPSDADAHEELGLLLSQQNDLAAAAEQFKLVLESKPGPKAHYELALACVMQGNRPEAVTHYREAISLNPAWPLPLNDLAWILATAPESYLRHGSEAVELAKKACELSLGKESRFYGTLDAALAEAGKFEDALTMAQRTKSMAVAARQMDVAEAAEKRMALYRQRKPFRQEQTLKKM